ncbi:MAG: hypothetical protein KA010_02505 [Saprospiraceae bacterium]|nr:hypothetical protein [Saprospiraceae bacterium]
MTEENNPNIASKSQILSFYRLTFHNHISLSSIADQKAHTIININSIIISILVSFLTYKSKTDANPMLLLPIIIFMVSALGSLVFAILSIRPKVTERNKFTSPEDFDKIKNNIIFFGNFVHHDEIVFEKAISEVLQDKTLLQGNLSRDMYQLGKVLDRKYHYLNIAYTIFMVGFTATIIAFFIAFFVGN